MSIKDPSQTICLAMIVRNEAPTIKRCLASVLPIIDHWIVVDTGSTDGTQEVVRECLKGVPGELIERPWVDFGHNRTESLAYARGHGSYVLVIDADEVLEVSDAFSKAELRADLYMVEVQYGNTRYRRSNLLRSGLPWRYVGVLHEVAVCDAAADRQPAAGLRIVAYHEGARSRDPNTYRRDAILLETALLDEPNNARYVFYLAQSYRDAGDLELAVRNYKRRVDMGGWGEEIWFSLYQIASLRERMGYPWSEVAQHYLAAFQLQPGRAEPLFRIGLHHQRAGEFHLDRLFFSRAIQLPHPPSERLFIETEVYRYQLPLEYAASCGHAGEHDEAITTCNRVLRSGLVAPEHLDRARQIRRFSVQARSRPRPGQGAIGRIKVCVPFCDPGSAFDDCVESLLLQSDTSFDVVFIDDGSRGDWADRIPRDRPGVEVLRNAASIGFEACVERLVSEQCRPDDIVIPLDHASRFANRHAMGRIRATLEAEGCQLLYGQHRLPTGALGDAEPAASEAEFSERGAALASRSPLIFRARVWSDRPERAAEGPSPGGDGQHGSQILGRSVRDGLMKAAGFEATRFVDHVFTAVGGCPTPVHAALSPTGRGMAEPSPLTVSCLMVTHDRLVLAKRAIRCFAHQTYANRELVVVCDGEPRIRRGLERFVAELGVERVRFVYPEGEKLSLGQLRNIAMDEASGEILCQWDDDDCYHPERVRMQVEHMLHNNGRACCLTDHLQFLDDDDALVWVDWTLGGKSGKHQLLPGTIVMFKDDRFRYPESGPFAQRGEDSMLLYQLCDNVPVVPASGIGYLYLYNYHGRNTFDRAHHYRLSSFSRSVADLTAERAAIGRAMAHFPVARPYLVIGRDGPAFVLSD